MWWERKWEVGPGCQLRSSFFAVYWSIAQDFPLSCIVPQSEMWIRPGRFEFSSTPSFFLPCATLPPHLHSSLLKSTRVHGLLIPFICKLRIKIWSGPKRTPSQLLVSSVFYIIYILYINLIAQSAYVSLNIANCHSDGLSRCTSRLFRFKRTLQWTLLLNHSN